MAKGLYRKYEVIRLAGTGPKHAEGNCEYFVLDLTHDPIARVAGSAYASAVRNSNPELYRDLSHKLFILSGWCSIEEADAWKKVQEEQANG